MTRQMSKGREVTEFLTHPYTNKDLDIALIQDGVKASEISGLVRTYSQIREPYTNNIFTSKEIFIVCQASYDDIKNLDCIDNVVICNYKGE